MPLGQLGPQRRQKDSGMVGHGTAPHHGPGVDPTLSPLPPILPCPPASGPQSRGRKGLWGFFVRLGAPAAGPPQPGREGTGGQSSVPSAEPATSRGSLSADAPFQGTCRSFRLLDELRVLRFTATQMSLAGGSKLGVRSRAGYVGLW